MSIFYPTGGGTGLIGMWKAFAELEAIGFIGSEAPADGCRSGGELRSDGASLRSRNRDRTTLGQCPYSGFRHPCSAGGGRLSHPSRRARERRLCIAVSDQAITDAVTSVARNDGVLLCPEGGATVAAYRQALADGRVRKDERVVLFNCATGLKYPLPPVHAYLDRTKPIDFAKVSNEKMDPLSGPMPSQ